MFSITTNDALSRFVKDWDQYVKNYPRHVRCLSKRQIDSGSKGMYRHVVAATKSRVPIINIRNAIDIEVRSDGAIVSINTRHRSGQVLGMMARGGTVRIPSRRLRSLVIIRDRRFRHARIRSLIRQTESTGKTVFSRGKQVTFSPKINGFTYIVVKTRRGKTLMVRSRQRGRNAPARVIAYLPYRANYRRQLFLSLAFNRAAQSTLQKDVKICLEQPLRQSLKKIYR